MRKSLEEIQSKHRADMEALQQKVDEAENKKDEAETQFQQLLERVNIIKSQLGERLKEDAVCCDFRLPPYCWFESGRYSGWRGVGLGLATVSF